MDDLEIMIEKEIEKFTISPEFLQWALEGLTKKNDAEIEDRTKIYEMQHKNVAETQKEMDELTKMAVIDPNTARQQKETIRENIKNVG